VGGEISNRVAADVDALDFLQATTSRSAWSAWSAWSARGVHRTLEVGRTIANQAGSEETSVTHIAEALQYRGALRPVD
jgi:magnesium chelatase family protein